MVFGETFGEIILINYLQIGLYPAAGEVLATVLGDEAITGAWECARCPNFCRSVLGHVADMMTIQGHNLDGVPIVWVAWLWHQIAHELTQIVVDILSILNAGNIELDMRIIIRIIYVDVHVAMGFGYDEEAQAFWYLCATACRHHNVPYHEKHDDSHYYQ